MKKLFYFMVLFFISVNNSIATNENITWVSNSKLRNGDFTYEDIPNIIANATDIFIWIAWSIAVVFIIIWAYKYLFHSLDGDTQKWKTTIIAAIFWFVIASCSYLIIKLVIDNFGWKANSILLNFF